MKTLWKKWCAKVEAHNAKQTYATHEECWEPTTIFAPAIIGVIITVIVCLVAYFSETEITLGKVMAEFLSSTALMGIMFYANWKAYD